MPALGFIKGQRFGRLTVEGPEHIGHGLTWHCVCDCGQTRSVPGHELKRGRVRSCGCLRRDLCRTVLRAKNVTHGARVRANVDPLYSVWQSMIRRCIDPKHKSWSDYGGRGVSVCSLWRHDFVAWRDHMGPRPSGRHSIDRKNNNGNYEPGNVRWATASEQALNRRPRTKVA